MNNCIIYVGDFDLRNENVQAHLVKNNGKILNNLGYTVAYIGVNRNITDFNQMEMMPAFNVENNKYLELPYSLNFKGLFICKNIIKQIISYMESILTGFNIEYVFSYQAPTYSIVLKYIAKWCQKNHAKYIVNCADLPIFDSQPLSRRLIMKLNWNYMHKINKKTADGIISVSKYIDKFYFKKNRPSVIIPPLFDEEIVACYKENDVATFLYAGTPFVSLNKEVNTKGMKDRLDKVIDLFLHLSEQGTKYKFIVVGITKEAYVTCVPKHKESLEKESKITFLGRKTHAETLSLLTQADFMINIRDKNIMTEAGLSTKVVESVSVGTPVVMNDIGDTFDYLEKSASGFLLSGFVEQDVATVVALCNLDKKERRNLKNQCLEKRTFSLECYQDVVKKFLEEV